MVVHWEDGTHAITIGNVTEGETVYQRCVLIKGQYMESKDLVQGFIHVDTKDASGRTIFPAQKWPVVNGNFKFLIILSHGINKLTLRPGDHVLTINYTPLLHTPPLYLAVFVGKNAKKWEEGSSRFEDVVARLRMAAYMWQALTAEDLRMRGLGRRSFRLEEEWTADTTSKQFTHSSHKDKDKSFFESDFMRSTAKVHLIKTENTVAQVLEKTSAMEQPEVEKEQEQLFRSFLNDLKKHGPPFQTSACPIVAGYVVDADNYVFHAPRSGGTACHNARGISLGMFGIREECFDTWPRFLEELTESLLSTKPGVAVPVFDLKKWHGFLEEITASLMTTGLKPGRDKTKLPVPQLEKFDSLGQACSSGQATMLREVGRALGAVNTWRLGGREYAPRWPRQFVCTKTDPADNYSYWHFQAALSFRCLPHFWMPGDVGVSVDARLAAPTVVVIKINDGSDLLSISCAARIIHIEFNEAGERLPSLSAPTREVVFSQAYLESRFPRDKPLKVAVLALNGKDKIVKNVWRLFYGDPSIIIPGPNVTLKKQSVTARDFEEEKKDGDDIFWNWAALLEKKDKDGKVQYATSIEIRRSNVLLGLYVCHGDERVTCGPQMNCVGSKHKLQGNVSDLINIPSGVQISKIEVSRNNRLLLRMRLHLSNGKAIGLLDKPLGDEKSAIESLSIEPPAGQRIVGFFGRNLWRNVYGLVQFGIITAPVDFVLPDVVYSMPELKNTDGGIEKKHYMFYGLLTEEDDASE